MTNTIIHYLNSKSNPLKELSLSHLYEENKVHISKTFAQVTHHASGKTWIKVDGHSHQFLCDEYF